MEGLSCSVLHTSHSVLFLSQSPRDLVPVVHFSLQDSTLHHMEKLKVDHHCCAHHPYYCGRYCRLLVFNAGEYLQQCVQLTRLRDLDLDLVNGWWSRNFFPQRSRKNLTRSELLSYESALSKCYLLISAAKKVHTNFHVFWLVFHKDAGAFAT